MDKKLLSITYCLLTLYSISQDTIVEKHSTERKHRLSFSTNIIPILINERSLSIDFCYNRRHSINLIFGQIYANPYLYVNYLSVDQSSSPGAVWNGIVCRLGYKYYFSPERNQYLELEVIYKDLHYSNMKFMNAISDDWTNTFYRDERANVYGTNLLYGSHLNSVENRFSVELFCGIGNRIRVRNYTTTESTVNNTSYPRKGQPLGSFNLRQYYPMIIIGLKIGINTFFK